MSIFELIPHSNVVSSVGVLFILIDEIIKTIKVRDKTVLTIKALKVLINRYYLIGNKIIEES